MGSSVNSLEIAPLPMARPSSGRRLMRGLIVIDERIRRMHVRLALHPPLPKNSTSETARRAPRQVYADARRRHDDSISAMETQGIDEPSLFCPAAPSA